MNITKIIYICLTIGGITGGYLGSLIDHGGGFGVWSIVFSAIGGGIGIWVGFKLSDQ